MAQLDPLAAEQLCVRSGVARIAAEDPMRPDLPQVTRLGHDGCPWLDCRHCVGRIRLGVPSPISRSISPMLKPVISTAKSRSMTDSSSSSIRSSASSQPA